MFYILILARPIRKKLQSCFFQTYNQNQTTQSWEHEIIYYLFA